MIQWLTMAHLEEALANVPPIGLALRGFYYGRVPASLSAVFDHPPEAAKIDDVGDVQIWAGAVHETPFTVTGHRRGELTAFQIALPIAVQEGQIDIRMLDVVESLSPLFHTARSPRVDSLPFLGGGFGVVPRGSNEALFRARRREDAELVASFLADPDRYEVAILPVAPPRWIVAGPRVGSTISRLEVADTREAADQLAAAWSAELGHAIDVFEGQLPT
ncbi:MAG: hypothetical protein JNL83_34765 [Myxococcales bacterium]|nr:hypothetical protein [Myxococcales bacterium]